MFQKAWVAPNLLALAILLGTVAAYAGTVTITGGGSSVASIPQCNYPGGPANNCKSTAFASGTSSGINTFFSGPFNTATIGEESFLTGFMNWNTAHGSKWTIVDGGSLNMTLTVNPFQASAGVNVGGISDITVTISNYVPGPNDPTLGQLV